MKSRYKVCELKSPHFITCTIVAWLPVFTRQKYMDIVISSLSFCRQEKGLLLHAYVILDNHLHLITTAPALIQLVRDFKRHTARGIIKLAQEDDKKWLLKQFEFHKHLYKAKSTYQVWQEGFHPQAIATEDMLRQKLAYIHHNPVRTGLVDRPEDWRYSSAKNYLGHRGVLEIDLIDF